MEGGNDKIGDFVDFMEYKKLHHAAKRYHMMALVCIRKFWRYLLDSVRIYSFTRLFTYNFLPFLVENRCNAAFYSLGQNCHSSEKSSRTLRKTVTAISQKHKVEREICYHFVRLFISIYRVLRDYARFLDEIVRNEKLAQAVSIDMFAHLYIRYSFIVCSTGKKQIDTKKRKWRNLPIPIAPLTKRERR